MDWRAISEEVTTSNWFNFFIVSTIIINAITIGLETYQQFSNWHPIFFIINEIALLIFVVEAAMKITAKSPNYLDYFKDSWNLFDFSIVVLAFIPAIGPLITIARTARLLRVVRLLGQFKDLKLIVNSFIRSFPSVISVILLMAVIVYIYAVFGYYFFHEIDPERWGTLGLSALTLFSMITLEGWDRVMYTVLDQIPLAWIYFVSFIIIGALMILNLFIGVMLYNITETREEADKQSLENLTLNETKKNNQILRQIQKELAKKRGKK